MLEKSRFKIANVALIESTQSSNSLESTTPPSDWNKVCPERPERKREGSTGFWILELKYVLEDLKNIYEVQL